MRTVNKKESLLTIADLDELHTTFAGYDILRYISLPELLGREAHTLFYFMGRKLARKIDIKSLDDIYFIFDKFGWGNLELVKEKRRELIFHLMADSVVHRLKASYPTDFRLEAGFLAEAIEMVDQTPCECIEEINRKILQIEFKVVFID